MKKKYTIKDIARTSGVSIGTVDRVIHKRGKVSEAALKKVNRALDQLDYVPNPIAQSLKNNRIYQVGVFVPDHTIDPYWLPCHEGILEIIAEFSAFDVEISVQVYSPKEPDAFLAMSHTLLKLDLDAMLFVPLFEKEGNLLLEKLYNKNILTGTFNSLLKKHVDQHIGQDLYLSGRVAAKLVRDRLRPSGKVVIVHIDEALSNSIHLREKEKGFVSFFIEQNIQYDLMTIALNNGNIKKSLENLLKENTHIEAFFVTTSKVYEIAEALHDLKIKAQIIGYDLLPENVACLEDEKIDFLIHQSPKLQAYLCLRNLIEKLLFKKELSVKQLLPIEIINSENVKSYV